jgi:hypothetical protein
VGLFVPRGPRPGWSRTPGAFSQNSGHLLKSVPRKPWRYGVYIGKAVCPMPLSDEQYQHLCREWRPEIEALASKMADRGEGQPPISTKTARLYWWTNRIAIGVAALSVLFFSFWPAKEKLDAATKPPTATSEAVTSTEAQPSLMSKVSAWCRKPSNWYVPVCFFLYMAWMFGVPIWFSLDFQWHYKESHQSLEEFKYRQELLKSGWVSVAVVLAALFTVTTHLELSEKPSTPEPKSAAAAAPAAKK